MPPWPWAQLVRRKPALEPLPLSGSTKPLVLGITDFRDREEPEGCRTQHPVAALPESTSCDQGPGEA